MSSLFEYQSAREASRDHVRNTFLKPGDFCFGEGKLNINTFLGSCISIVMWHPVLAHGGMCHFMLPRNRQANPSIELDGKYAEEAMELFMLELDKRGTQPSQYKVGVYGGGHMFNNLAQSGIKLCEQNIDVACKLLDEHGFSIADVHLGSFGYRKIQFDVWSGEVRLAHIDNRQEFPSPLLKGESVKWDQPKGNQLEIYTITGAAAFKSSPSYLFEYLS